jgi:hypothetical protein
VIDGFAELLAHPHGPEPLEVERWRGGWNVGYEGAWRAYMQADNVLEWQTAPVPADLSTPQAVFVWPMGLGQASDLPQPTGRFDLYVNDALAVSCCVTRSSRRWERGDAAFYGEVKRVDDYHGEPSVYGLGYLALPSERLTPGQPVRMRLVPSDTQSRQWFALCRYRGGALGATYLDRGLDGVLLRPEPPPLEGGWRAFWGDIHNHTGISACATGTVEEVYDYARHVAGLDFFSLTDHSMDLTDDLWAEWLEKGDECNEPGRFATLHGFEWTSFIHGHRNVYYRARGPFVHCPTHDATKTLSDLYAAARTGGEFLIVKHHPSALSMGLPNFDDYFGETVEPVIEIYSVWGCSEYAGHPLQSRLSDHQPDRFVQDALARGFRFGFIGSGDSHDGHPGNTQWSRDKQEQAGIPPTPLGGGLAAVLTQELTREAVFDALRERRCYATTSAKILLDFRVNNALMGRVLPHDGQPPRLRVYAVGTTEIDLLEVVRDNAVVYRGAAVGRQVDTEILDPTPEAARGPHFYYARLRQRGGHWAWSSPVWLT